MWKVCLIGIVSALLALPLKKDKPEYAYMLAAAGCILILGYSIGWMYQIVEFIGNIIEDTHMDNTYFSLIMKMLGITYCADITSNICKDSGHSALAGQIEIFAKLSIIVLSIPGLKYFVSVMENFL